MTTLEAAIQAVEKVRWKHSFDLVQGKKFGPTEQSEETARAVIQAIARNLSKEMIAAGMVEAEDAMDEDWDSGGDGESYNSYTTLRSDASAKIFIAMLAAILNEENNDGS